MPDRLIKLTEAERAEMFYVDPTRVVLVEPKAFVYGKAGRSIVHIEGEIRRTCCETPDEIRRAIESAFVDYRESDGGAR